MELSESSGRRPLRPAVPVPPDPRLGLATTSFTRRPVADGQHHVHRPHALRPNQGKISISISLYSFTQTGAADAAARLRLTADGQGVTVEGASLKGRAVEWLKEAFGDGKAANRRAI
jgi:hypothetical protein